MAAITAVSDASSLSSAAARTAGSHAGRKRRSVVENHRDQKVVDPINDFDTLLGKLDDVIETAASVEAELEEALIKKAEKVTDELQKTLAELDFTDEEAVSDPIDRSDQVPFKDLDHEDEHVEGLAHDSQGLRACSHPKDVSCTKPEKDQDRAEVEVEVEVEEADDVTPAMNGNPPEDVKAAPQHPEDGENNPDETMQVVYEDDPTIEEEGKDETGNKDIKIEATANVTDNPESPMKSVEPEVNPETTDSPAIESPPEDVPEQEPVDKEMLKAGNEADDNVEVTANVEAGENVEAKAEDKEDPIDRSDELSSNKVVVINGMDHDVEDDNGVEGKGKTLDQEMFHLFHEHGHDQTEVEANPKIVLAAVKTATTTPAPEQEPEEEDEEEDSKKETKSGVGFLSFIVSLF